MPAAARPLLSAALIAALICLAGPLAPTALAQSAGGQGEAQQQPRAVNPEEEITIIAPRRNVPDYQTFDEFQREEFEKIRGRYETPPPRQPRGDEVLSTSVAKGPNDQSDVRRMMREAPRLRELVD